MLNLKEHDNRISELENNLDYQMEELEEQREKYELYGYDMRRCIVAIILSFAFIALVLFVLIYPPTRHVIANILRIDFSNFPKFSTIDALFLIGTYSLIVAVIALLVSWGTDENYGSSFWSTLFIPTGLYQLFNSVGLCSHLRWETKEEISATQQEIESLKEQISAARADRQVAEKAMAKSNWLFEKGRTDNDFSLIRQAADMGNPSALAYIEMLKKRELQDEAERYYRQAKRTDPVDQELLKKAAAMGYPRAVTELAEQLFLKVNSPLYANIEKEMWRKQANDYLEQTDFSAYPDGEILRIVGQLDYKEDVNYFELLNKARKAQESGGLSARYSQLADSVIKRLIKEVDSMVTDDIPVLNIDASDEPAVES